MKPERNSEGKLTILGIILIVGGVLGAVATSLLSSGALDPWPIAVGVAGGAVALSKLLGDYSLSRPAAHLAKASLGGATSTPDPMLESSPPVSER